MEDKNLELMDSRINELLEKQGKLTIGTEEYNNVQTELDRAVKSRESYARTLQQKIDDQEKNDISRQELVIKQQEVDVKAQEANNGKWRNGISIFVSMLYAATSCWTGMKSYKMEERTIGWKPMQERARELRQKIGK